MEKGNIYTVVQPQVDSNPVKEAEKIKRWSQDSFENGPNFLAFLIHRMVIVLTLQKFN